MQFLYYGLAIFAGLVNPIQSAANAALNKGTHQPVLSGLVIYRVAVSGLLLCSTFLGLSFKDLGGRLGGLPWWAFVGGLGNLAFVLAAAVGTREIGSAAFTVATSVFAIVLSIVLDKYGLMGLEVREISWQRLVGAGMAVGGVVLVSRY